MASAGTTVRKDLQNLSNPLQVRELNRQLEWLWKQLLGGLTEKSFSGEGVKQIIRTVEKTIVSELEADEIDVTALKSALIEVMVSQIGVANIDYAQIVDGFMSRLFVDDVLADKLRCERLLIDSAQITDLEVGAFRLVSSSGKVYKVDVNADGSLSTEYLYNQDEWFEGGAPPKGYNAVASGFSAGEVTAGTLYVTGEASFLKVISKYLEVDTAHINSLFASEAAITILNTYDIRNSDCITLSVGGEKKTVARLIPGVGFRIGEDGSAFTNTISDVGWEIAEQGMAVIRCFDNKIISPRVQVGDALMLGGAAFKVGGDKHLRLLKYGR